MSLLDAKPIYKPFHYPWAYDAWLTQQRIHWLPEEVPLADDVIKTEREPGWDYVYEPDAQVVIDDLLLRYVEALIYQAVAENMASEQSARMVAMKSASDNAKSVIGELKLVYNKARQAAITKELSEIVSGAAAV